MKYLVALLIAPGLAGLGVSHRLQAQTVYGTNSIGYIGCSNTRGSVAGYHRVAGNKGRIWTPYNTGGGRIDLWQPPTSTQYWTLYQQQLALYGQPKAVWVQLCERYQDASGAFHINTYSQVQTMLASSIMGSQGQGETDTQSWAQQAVNEGLGLAGPKLGPLTLSLISSTDPTHCHPSTEGENFLGRQLIAFFDRL
jgi:hypothetical protein